MVAGRGDAWFLQLLDPTSEWVDLELLLRLLKEIHAQVLLLSTPLDGQFYDQIGVPRWLVQISIFGRSPPSQNYSNAVMAGLMRLCIQPRNHRMIGRLAIHRPILQLMQTAH
jgi:hypothetical protein